MKTNNKLREALTRVKKIATSYINCHDDEIDRAMTEIVATCDSALAEPVKNCEVGTVDDQKDRFLEFCDDEKGPREHCRNCRLCNSSDCELAWAQLPYTEGGEQ